MLLSGYANAVKQIRRSTSFRQSILDQIIAEGLVFTKEMGCPVDPRNVKRVLDRLVRTAGLPHCRIHDPRHFYASALLAEGVELRVVSHILGHKDIGITAMVYTHVSEPGIRDAMDQFERFTARGKRR